MYGAIKAAMFRMDPERAHRLAMGYLHAAHKNPFFGLGVRAGPSDPRLRTTVAGIEFANPIGVAAGFDKEAEAYNALLAMGFGHVELGTVTRHAQPGNPKPRIHRVPDHGALINSMGFPGPGWDVLQARLQEVPPRGPIGINIGPNKDATRQQGRADLAHMAGAANGDYIALNISSPNTPGLRDLQEPTAIADLVAHLKQAIDDGLGQPLFLKLHPDAPDEELVAVARAAIDGGADGIIATNTTRQRPDGIPDLPGGLSGEPLRSRARGAVAALARALDVPIIGVGGIATGRDAFAMLQAGASLVQVYTGFIYRGPKIAQSIQKELLAELDDAGLDRLT